MGRRRTRAASRFSEEKIIGILREHEAGAKTRSYFGGTGSCAQHSGRHPRSNKVSGSVLTIIDCKHLSSIITQRRAQMRNPLTLSATNVNLPRVGGHPG